MTQQQFGNTPPGMTGLLDANFPPQRDWQEIWTAPDSGRYFLVALRGKATVAHKWRGEWIDVLDDCRVIEPTHWMPFPEPPAA